MKHDRGNPWTKKEVVVALQRYAEILGETPSCARIELDKKHLPWLPYAGQIRHVFGTYNAAVEAAGLDPRKSTRPA